MARYKFPNVEAVTNNSEFINECFDSIRDGTPLIVETTEGLQLTCLEYLLDAVIDSSSAEVRVRPEIFDQLATINLNAHFCHEILDTLESAPSTSCLPHVINAYVSVAKGGATRFSGDGGSKLANQALALNNVRNSMRKIVSSYPDLMAQRVCRPSPKSTLHSSMRDHYTCIDKLLNMGHEVNFIRAEDFPDGYFDQPLCQEGTTGKAITCFNRLITSGTSIGSSYSQTNTFDNCYRLLESIITSKKYDRELFADSGRCSPAGAMSSAAWCLEKLIHPAHRNARSAKLHELLLKTYSVNVDGKETIDEKSEMSPFSGKKCLSSSGLDIFSNCIGELLKVSIGLKDVHDASLGGTDKIAMSNIQYILSCTPQSGDPCKQLELINTLLPFPPDLSKTSDDLLKSILDNSLPRKESAFDELAAITCMSNVMGIKHKVNGVDYALELGRPMIYLIHEDNNKHIDEVLRKLSKPICTSIKTNDPIPCYEKLATELLVDPLATGGDAILREESRNIVNSILYRGTDSLRDVVYPEGKPYFTDYLIQSIYNTTRVTPIGSTTMMFLDTILDNMSKSKIIFKDNLGLILEILKSGQWKYHITPSTRKILHDRFVWSDDDIMKAVTFDGFWAADSDGGATNSISILSQWYAKYKGNPIGDVILSRVSGGIATISPDSEIGNDGLARCQEERERLEESCEENCFDDCHDANNYDPGDDLDDIVDKRLDVLIKKEIGKYIQLSDQEKFDVAQGVRDDHADRIRSDAISSLITTCQSSCGEECSEYVNDTFNCREYLINEGYFKTKVSDGILPEFRRIYQELVSANKTSPNVEQLFFDAYGKTMEEKFKPSLESRIEFDKECFRNGSKYRSGSKTASGLDFIYNNVAKASELKPDDLGIVGVYDIMDGYTGQWSDDHLWKYAKEMRKVLWGSTEVIGEPYIHRRESDKWMPVPIGLINAVESISRTSPLETIGDRKNNVKGRLHIIVTPSVEPQRYPDSHAKDIIALLRTIGSDFKIVLAYVDERGVTIPDQVIKYKTPEGERERIVPTTISFNLIDAIRKMPTKLKKQLQENYPVLFSQLSTIIRMEEELPEEDQDSQIKRYKMVISNKPTDIVRCAGCQEWDRDSCISIFGGFHNSCLQCYLRGDSYIAYLTRASEYEPEWRARILIHKCTNGKSVSIQRVNDYYDVPERGSSGSGRSSHPNWYRLYGALRIVLADKGVNTSYKSAASCAHAWIKEDGNYAMNERCSNSDGGGYVDYHMIDPLKVGNAEYNGILEEYTGQNTDSSKFVKQVRTEF